MNIVIKSAPKQYQAALRKADSNEGANGFNGKIDTQSEVNAAAKAYCASGKDKCDAFLKWLDSQGVKPTIKVTGVAEVEPKKSSPIKGYFYTFGGLKFRGKADGSVRIFGNSSWGGYGVDNGDAAGKEAFHIDAQGLTHVTFKISTSVIDGKEQPLKLTRFKVEINNNEVQWFNPGDIPADGIIKVKLDSELFEATGGKLLKFQLVFSPGQVNFQISDIEAIQE